jgi:recombinational DNA repair protein RecR
MDERLLHELPHRMAFAGRQHVIAGRLSLQDAPRIEIAEIDPVLQPVLDRATARVILRVTKVLPRIGLS